MAREANFYGFTALESRIQEAVSVTLSCGDFDCTKDCRCGAQNTPIRALLRDNFMPATLCPLPQMDFFCTFDSSLDVSTPESVEGYVFPNAELGRILLERF